MSTFQLAEELFLYPTPSGAYYSVSSGKKDKPRRFLQRLLQQTTTPKLSINNLKILTKIDDEEKAIELLNHCQKLGWVQGIKEAKNAPLGVLEEILPGLLERVSETGKILMADGQGFYIASNGFTHETAEELSVLGAEIETVHDRRSGLIMNNLGIASHAWAIVDAFGNSQIGFWPVYIGKNRFVITISGIPHFNQAEFIDLIWALTIRYSGQ